ncbi:cytohesin-interacting protein-like [Stegostoma tigrinum]|uniref:cytohesin-interacting protein-like n=1 Tax=Stegostoma tigrinum TaxID=3053191 RepID=UPI00202B6BEE|nr:cytohesin-interacting protein-like [Stegostoma tigrinum]
MTFQSVLQINVNANYMAADSSSASCGSYSEISNRSFSAENDNKRLQILANSLGTLPRGHRQLSLTRSNSLADTSDFRKKMVVLNKQDNETFGFEIQTVGMDQQNANTLQRCTFVCKVHDNSPSHFAGLKAGDMLVNINGVDTEGFSHQEIVDLIKSSGNLLSVLTVHKDSIRRDQLETRLHFLKKTLQEKWVEYRSVLLQEQRLVHGLLRNGSTADSFVYNKNALFGSTRQNKERFSSDSSCRSQLSLMTVDSEDYDFQLSVFDDSGSQCRRSSMDEECIFHREPETFTPKTHLSRSRSISLSSNGSGHMPPSWDSNSGFGTISRRSRKPSVRKRLMKFIPGLNRSVEEDESHF